MKWIRYETPFWQTKCFGLVNRILRRVRPSWQLTDSREQVRAVRALPALAALGPEITIPEITRMLDDPKAITRKELAVMAFGYLGKDSVPPLLNLLTNEHGGNLRYAALAIIRALGTNARAAGPVLLQYLSDKDWLLSAKVYYAIDGMEIDPAIAVPILMETLQDTRADVLECAIRLLKTVNTNARPATPLLLNLLSDRRIRIKNAAKAALREIDPEALEKARTKGE